MDQTTTVNYQAVKLIILAVIVALLLITVTAAFFSGKAKARDQIRAGDVSLIQKFLAAYKNNNGSYPQASSTNQAIGWEQYLEKWPTAPTPADGSCNSAENTYKYSPLNAGASYKLTFCLGQSVSNYSSGINTAGPQ